MVRICSYRPGRNIKAINVPRKQTGQLVINMSYFVHYQSNIILYIKVLETCTKDFRFRYFIVLHYLHIFTSREHRWIFSFCLKTKSLSVPTSTYGLILSSNFHAHLQLYTVSDVRPPIFSPFFLLFFFQNKMATGRK